MRDQRGAKEGPPNEDELVALAKGARRNAYAPYSDFAVGAALLARSGRVYTGCNVENASYGLSICAERVALFKAVAGGEREFTAIAVVTETGATPCGACRQVLREFGDDLRVIVANLEGERQVYTLEELLPHSFTAQQLPGKG
ncbi:MAG TPA: cytidine deaminase [Anaerolineae bacterium]|nr:cytidine deaminase [Anaerolineae bacterium]